MNNWIKTIRILIRFLLTKLENLSLQGALHKSQIEEHSVQA